MVKQIALALGGIVLAFAVCRAAPLYEKVCKAPDVPRVVEGLLPGLTIPHDAVLRVSTYSLVCPQEGWCHYEAEKVTPPPPDTNVICLTPAEHEAALERGK